MKRTALRVRDLKDQTGTAFPRPSLYCHVCNGLYSANASDYFMAPADKALECCGEPMRLVVRKVTLEEVAA